MKIVYIYCEGRTEESFINHVLYSYFFNIGIAVKPIVCTTKRVNSVKFKGGVNSYGKIKKELKRLCGEHPKEMLTTMFDFYGMPDDVPNINNHELDIYRKVEKIERSIAEDINMPNLFFGLVLHEFEGLLFSYPQAFKEVVDSEVVNRIARIREEVKTPEHINNLQETAPSKRLGVLIPNYPKVKYGTIVAKAIGIDRIIEECQHFARWIDKIRNC